jgi:hypothetical protein
MMIGGPADLVIEANIVRAAKPARDVHVVVSPAATDMLPRPVPLEGGSMWPLQPEPAPIQGVDALALKAPQRHAAAPPPALTAKEDTEWSPDPEPPRPHQTEPQRMGPPARDPLVSLAKELTRTAQPQPAPATPELRPARHKARIERSQAAESPLLPPPAPSADKTQFNSPEDQGLAEMTQRLAAALRRSPKAD